MDVGQLANITGVHPRSIRRYAELGLIGQEQESGVLFSQTDIHCLKIFKLAQCCGYSVQDILSIVDAKNRDDIDVLRSALDKLGQLRKSCSYESAPEKSEALLKLRNELQSFIDSP